MPNYSDPMYFSLASVVLLAISIIFTEAIAKGWTATVKRVVAYLKSKVE